jgi:peptide deformylase
MAKLEIVKVPNPVLRKVAEKVKGYTSDLEKLAQDMAETMYGAPGVGLAANQVAVTRRVIVIDVSPPDKPKNLLVLINPEILESEGLDEIEEGCLSVPEFKQFVERPTKIKVRAKNLKGEEVEFTAEGLLARAIQHEFDHIQGRLLLDYAGSIKKQLYLKKRRKLLKQQE